MEIGKAIVTGGAGFIGSHLVDTLVARGVAVTVIDREDPTSETRNAKADYRKMDIRDEGLRGVFQAVQPDVVFHLAAHIDDRESMRKPVYNAEENILGSLGVFEAARIANAKKIVFASTGVAYGNVDQLPITETVLPKPLTPYGVSKLAGERYLNFYWTLYKLPYAALRIANVYGPRQDGSRECGAIAIFTRKLLRGEVPVLNNDGKTTRDYVHVDDVVAAMLAAATGDAMGIFNVGTGIGTATADVYAKVAAAVGADVVPAAGDQQDMVKHVALANAKAKAELGWEPRTMLDEGIARTVRWYREHLVV